MSFSMRCGQADSFLFHDYHLYCLSSSWRPVLTPYSFSQQQFLAKNQKEIDPPPHPFLFSKWWFIYCVLLFHYCPGLHVGDSYGTVRVVLNYSLLFSKSLFHSLFPSFCRANVCLLVSLCKSGVRLSSPLSLFYYSQTATKLCSDCMMWTKW